MAPQFLLAGAALLAFGASAPLCAQLKLVPAAGTFVGEGTPFPCIRFRDGAKVVRFMPPEGWRFRPDGPRCVFNYTGKERGSGSFSAQALPADRSPEARVRRAEELLAATIPSGATDLEMKLTGLPAVKLDHWEAQHVQATYAHFGQKFQVALLIVPLEREELHARFESPDGDFERIFPPFLESLGTFTWDPQDEDKPAGNGKR